MDDYYKAYNGGKGFKKIRDKFGTIAAIKYTFNKQAQEAVFQGYWNIKKV